MGSEALSYQNVLLTLPKKNRTMPVTPQAPRNNSVSDMKGKKDGKTRYPTSGKAPKKAKEQNMMTPGERHTVRKMSARFMVLLTTFQN